MQGRREQCPTQLSRFTQEQATSLAVCSGLTLAQQAMHTLWQLSEAPQWLAAMKINPARRSYMMQGDMKEEAEKRNLLHLTPFPGLTLWPSHTHQSHHVFIWHHGQSYPATPSCHGRLRSVKTTKPTHKYVVWWHKRWCNWIRFHTFLLASLLLQAHVCRCHGDDKNRAVFSSVWPSSTHLSPDGPRSACSQTLTANVQHRCLPPPPQSPHTHFFGSTVLETTVGQQGRGSSSKLGTELQNWSQWRFSAPLSTCRNWC